MSTRMPTMWGAPFQPDNIEDFDYAVLGIPYDQGSGLASTSRWGPTDIRAASVRHFTVNDEGSVALYRFQNNEPFLKVAKVCDLGDAPIFDETLLAAEKLVHELVKAEGPIPIILGGDHSLTVPVCRAVDPDYLVLFDAHADNADDSSHASVSPRVSVKGVVRFGLRAPTEKPVGSAPLDELTGQRIHLSIDMDVFDIHAGTGYPVWGGMGMAFFQQCLGLLFQAGPKLVSVDVTETSDHHIPEHPVANLAAQVAAEVMHWWSAGTNG